MTAAESKLSSEIKGPVHLIGIGGIHMSAIAMLLNERGIEVRGSDQRASAMTEKLEALGIPVFIGHKAEQVGDAKLVVTTAAAQDTNAELEEARQRDIPILIRAEMVARLMEGKRVIAVAGAHGKTTTSSLVALILKEAGMEPMYLLGGESLDLDGHASWGEGEFCVVEADEYKRAFHEYDPEIAIITNVEADHLDYYGTAEAYAESFVVFGRRIRPEGLLIICADDPGARGVSDILGDDPIRQETYGISGTRFWMGSKLRLTDAGATFDLTEGGRPIGELKLFAPGAHFVLNAIAATAACRRAGVPFETIQRAVAKFRGARRRFEVTGEADGVLVMDDYAHHPTEVRSTIAAARNRFPGRRLIGIHQPHTYSRISYLWDEWTRCWDGLDELVILETYAARESPIAGRSAEDLARAIRSPKAIYARDFADAAEKTKAIVRPGDVVFTIGAGDVNEVGPRLLDLLSLDKAATP